LFTKNHPHPFSLELMLSAGKTGCATKHRAEATDADLEQSVSFGTDEFGPVPIEQYIRWMPDPPPLLRISTFCLCIGVYFLQPGLASPHALTAPEYQGALAWLPTYWFLGLVQQLNGSTEGPAQAVLSMLAARASTGLAIAGAGDEDRFCSSITELCARLSSSPILSPHRGARCGCPGSAAPYARPSRAVHYPVALTEPAASRDSRVLVGHGIRILILFLKTPFAQKIAALAGTGVWRQASVPVIASSFVVLCFWMLGIRIATTMPLELRANWIFRIVPLPRVTAVLNALRAALYTIAVAPLWVTLAVLLVWDLAAKDGGGPPGDLRAYRRRGRALSTPFSKTPVHLLIPAGEVQPAHHGVLVPDARHV
jgi:hypothetical protein